MLLTVQRRLRSSQRLEFGSVSVVFLLGGSFCFPPFLREQQKWIPFKIICKVEQPQ